MAQLYKATDALIDAVYSCLQRGLDIDLVVVGDGKYRPELESRAATLNLKERVRFLGQLPAGEAVRTQLDQADLFVLPSRSEGLPRAMIEAMARGKPCIGTTAGGIPELLSAEDLVPPGDVAALANKICQVVSDPERMIRMGRRNLEKAKEYCEDTLRERRITFYRYLRRRTEEWQKANKIA
jgi:glycosyltransferase involved in cell wall biosynthesis